MSRQIVDAVPHVHGYKLESIEELMDDIVADGRSGNERFCTRRNFPGFPGLGTMESGAVWKGPMSSSVSDLDIGPI